VLRALALLAHLHSVKYFLSRTGRDKK